MKLDRTRFIWIAGVVALTAALILPARARDAASASGQAGRTVDAATRAAVVEKVVRQLNEYYVDPDMAATIEAALRSKLAQGAYEGLTSQRDFLSRLTEDLRAVSHDLHLGVWPIEMALGAEGAPEALKEKYRAQARYNHYGFQQLSRLPGNIGYLEMSYFEELDLGGDMAVAAMNWLSGCDALIIDVRRNGGGSDVVKLIKSYLFKEAVHSADVYSRMDKTTRQDWTLDYVPGPRLADIPVYVLQSRRSASASEGLAYFLQNTKRATIVGEVSRGAANPIEEFTFPELSICMAVSAYRVTSPVTGTCWEGTGVRPDIAVPAEKALETACVEALKTLLVGKADEDIRRWRTWALERYRALLEPVIVSEKELAACAGSYGPAYGIRLEGGRLSLTNKVRMPITLIALGRDAFAFQEEEGVARFERDASGKVTGLDIRFADGLQASLKKDRRP
jgi:hypothetical protein